MEEAVVKVEMVPEEDLEAPEHAVETVAMPIQREQLEATEALEAMAGRADLEEMVQMDRREETVHELEMEGERSLPLQILDCCIWSAVTPQPARVAQGDRVVQLVQRVLVVRAAQAVLEEEVAVVVRAAEMPTGKLSFPAAALAGQAPVVDPVDVVLRDALVIEATAVKMLRMPVTEPAVMR